MHNERDQITLHQHDQQDKRADETRDGCTVASLPGNEIHDSDTGQDEREEGTPKDEAGPQPGTKYPAVVSHGPRDGGRSFHATMIAFVKNSSQAWPL